MAGEERVDDLGDDSVVVAAYAWEDGVAGLEPGDEVLAELLLDAAVAVAGLTELAEGCGVGVLVGQIGSRRVRMGLGNARHVGEASQRPDICTGQPRFAEV